MRARAQRNFITTLLLSQGVPMILHGDEIGRTQDGNNNTYAQDSEICLGALGPGRRAAGRVHRGGAPAARRAPDVPAQAVLHRRHRAHRARRHAGSTTSSGCTPRASRWRTTTGRPAAPARSGCTSTATASPATTPPATRSWTTTSCSTSTPAHEPGRGRAPLRRSTPRRGTWSSTPPRPGWRTEPHGRRRQLTLEGRSVLVLREFTESEPEADSSVAASLVALAEPHPVPAQAVTREQS